MMRTKRDHMMQLSYYVGCEVSIGSISSASIENNEKQSDRNISIWRFCYIMLAMRLCVHKIEKNCYVFKKQSI